MNDRFDVVVIGSGFGGSVMAYRLAAAGKRVCLLERGKPYPPGSFSRTPYELRGNFWDPSAQRYGLFNIWSFRHIASIVSAGLGGGSLIYANVMIRKDENWFVTRASERDGYESWPVTRKDLDPHYDAVQRIQQPAVYPDVYQRDNKTAALRAAAKRLGIPETTFDHVDPAQAQWYLPLLAITFARDGEVVPGRVFDQGTTTARRAKRAVSAANGRRLHIRRQEHARLHLRDPRAESRRRHPAADRGEVVPSRGRRQRRLGRDVLDA